MSIACKCERCGKFYEPNNKNEINPPNQVNSRITFNAITLNHKDYKNDSVNNVGFTRVDVCPECARSFTIWWINPGITINNSYETSISLKNEKE